MCYFFIGFFSVALLMGVGFYETLRWHGVRTECETRRENHNKLLASDVCKKSYGEGVDALCNKAHTELNTHIYISTTLEWWRQGEIFRLYTRLTESYTSLLVLVLLPILYVIYKIFDALKQKDIDDRVERMINRQSGVQLIPYHQPQQEDRRNEGYGRSRANYNHQFISGPKDY